MWRTWLLWENYLFPYAWLSKIWVKNVFGEIKEILKTAKKKKIKKEKLKKEKMRNKKEERKKERDGRKGEDKSN